jgi:hypothetical protein
MSDLNVYTTSQIDALTPLSGDLVVDSDLNAVKLYDGSVWRKFAHEAKSLLTELSEPLVTEAGEALIFEL